MSGTAYDAQVTLKVVQKQRGVVSKHQHADNTKSPTVIHLLLVCLAKEKDIAILKDREIHCGRCGRVHMGPWRTSFNHIQW